MQRMTDMADMIYLRAPLGALADTHKIWMEVGNSICVGESAEKKALGRWPERRALLGGA